MEFTCKTCLRYLRDECEGSMKGTHIYCYRSASDYIKNLTKKLLIVEQELNTCKCLMAGTARYGLSKLCQKCSNQNTLACKDCKTRTGLKNWRYNND